MGKRAVGGQHSRVIQEAARIICEERLSDYRLAKQKAAERLGFGANTPMPSNVDIQAAVIQYQRLFGGRQYADRLQLLRATAVKAMRLLGSFQPRLVGAVASGATTEAHNVQLHGFADQPERLDSFLQDCNIRFETGARRYRYPEGRVEEQPTVSFMADEIGVEITIFPEAELRRAPLSPVDGLPMKRLALTEVESLVAAPPEVFCAKPAR